MKKYKKHLGIFRNKSVRVEINSLDAKDDHCRIVELLTGYEFPWDMVRALEVALMRTFCSPPISALLHRTGEFRKHGQKRYDDTALLVAEFMENGYDGEKGKRAIAHMNMIHGKYLIENDDFIFVLSTFVLQPIQWIEQFGWRKISEKERLALFYFFKEVGKRMNIKNIPETLPLLNKFVSDYESKNFVYKDTNKAVGNATVNIVKGWMPFFLRPFVFPVMKCLLNEFMLKALGYTSPNSLLKATVNAAMKARAFALRYITFKKYPSYFTTGSIRTYPHGYEIESLGPENLIRKLS